MTDHDTPTVAPPPPADTIPPPPDYDALVESPLVRRAADPPPSPYAGLAEMVRNILAIAYHEDRQNKLPHQEAQQNNANQLDNLKRLAESRGYNLSDPATER